MAVQVWSRQEEILVLDLYYRIPFKKSSKSHPEVIRIANIIGRSPSAVNMKIGNFGHFDTSLKVENISGLIHTSKLDEKIWNEFYGHWDLLAQEAYEIFKIYGVNEKIIEDIDSDVFDRKGKDITITTTSRINQAFFRNAVLSAYNDACCITGLSTKSLLRASHIKPWKDSTDEEKTDPRNGLCLNALLDAAFDKGLMTLTLDGRVHFSNYISDMCNGETVDRFFKKYEDCKIIAADRFQPLKEYIEYHNDVIFER